MLTLKMGSGCWPFEGLPQRTSNPVKLDSEDDDDVKFMIPTISLYDLSAASTRCLKL
jgi:hypothetical protein